MGNDTNLKDFDVALSFAGEDRGYVEAVADTLKSKNIRVFYDKYETVSLWGKDLYVHLDEVYRKRARYTVMFLSKHYAQKLWTNKERESAQARAFGQRSEYILPARFDDTEIPGILPTVAYVSLKEVPPEKLAEMIVQKLDGPSPVPPPIPPRDEKPLPRWLRIFRNYKGPLYFAAAAILLIGLMVGLVAWWNTSRNFDAVADFSLKGSSVWSYGYYACNIRDRFVPFEKTSRTVEGNPKIEGYYAGPPGTWVPLIDHNTSREPLLIFHDTIKYPPNVLRLHPGPVSQPAIIGGQNQGCVSPPVVRWTAPRTATYRITGYFVGLDQNTSTTGRIVDSQQGDLLSLEINKRERVPFETSVLLNAGDYLDFVVNGERRKGGDCPDWCSDSTGLALQIKAL